MQNFKTGTMKTKVLLSVLVLFSLAACKKAAQILPNPAKTQPIAVATKPDTIPDKAIIKLKLSKDTINTDETAFIFNSTGKATYNPMEDAPYFPGNGQVSLASISSEGRDLAINNLPYTAGMSIRLDANTRATGAYSLAISYQSKIPTSIHIWLKDIYLKDSLDVSTKSYSFNVNLADTNTFGKNRFKLILKNQ
jgi:trimeric autotransporter adhesin